MAINRYSIKLVIIEIRREQANLLSLKNIEGIGKLTKWKIENAKTRIKALKNAIKILYKHRREKI